MSEQLFRKEYPDAEEIFAVWPYKESAYAPFKCSDLLSISASKGTLILQGHSRPYTYSLQLNAFQKRENKQNRCIKGIVGKNRIQIIDECHFFQLTSAYCLFGKLMSPDQFQSLCILKIFAFRQTAYAEYIFIFDGVYVISLDHILCKRTSVLMPACIQSNYSEYIFPTEVIFSAADQWASIFLLFRILFNSRKSEKTVDANVLP